MELPCLTAVSDRSIPLFEKRGQGRFVKLFSRKSPSFPLFVKGM